jgi:hypothetical protein
MRELRERLAKSGPLVTVNVQGSAIAKLFRLPDDEADFAAVAQQFGVAVIVELLIVMSLVAFELLRRDVHHTIPAQKPIGGKRSLRESLGGSSNENAADQIKRFFRDAVRLEHGKRIGAATLLAAYQAWCAAKGLKPQSATMFGRLAPWPKERVGGRVWYVNAILLEKNGRGARIDTNGPREPLARAPAP